MKATECRPAAHVLGVDVDAIDLDEALGRVAVLLQGSRKSYVCVAGVHGIMEAQRNPQLMEVYSGSEMTIPDGMPLAWVGRMQGHIAMPRVTGPDLMLEVFRRKEFARATHFLYGGREGIAEELRDKLRIQFPWVKIVGTYTPPFRALNPEEERDLQATVARLKPDVFWIGLSTPKQERFMAQYLSKLDTKVMIGVGAAFDIHTGRIKESPEWLKATGMQWFHRMCQEPGRLWKRYLYNNPRFIVRITAQLLGFRKYELA